MIDYNKIDKEDYKRLTGLKIYLVKTRNFFIKTFVKKNRLARIHLHKI